MKNAYRLIFLTSVALGISAICATAAPPSDDWMGGFKMPVVAEPTIQARTMRVSEFGAVPDGRTLCTEAIAKGIDTLAAQGGGRLVFSAGVWLTGPIILRSGVELHTEAGALIQFSNDHSLFKARGLIFGENLQDVAITGQGIIDGAGDAWRPVKKGKMTEGRWKELIALGGRLDEKATIWYPRTDGDAWRPRLLVLRNCKRVMLEGTTFQNSPNWNLHPHFCDDLTIRNVIIRNPWYSQNGDGLDIDACRNVIVRGTRLDVGDDALCLKSGIGAEARKTGRPTENVLIEDCVVYHGHGGFTIGSEMSGGIRNVRVNNCVFIGTDVGLRFKTQRGRGGVVENIFISNIRMTDIATTAISFNMYYGGSAPKDENGSANEAKIVPVDEGTPQFREIYIEDVLCRGAQRAVQLQGLPEMPIRGIHLRDIAITATNGIVCQDAQDITFQRVEILNAKGSVVEATRIQDVQIDQLTYTPGAEALFALSGKTTAGIVVRNTDLKSAKTIVNLKAGATQESLQVK